MNENDDAEDVCQQREELELRRRGPAGYASVWSPVMTEQQRKEHEQYVKDNALPF